MTRIVTTHERRYQRRNKAAQIESRVVTATKPGKRARPSDDADVEVPESDKAFVNGMMQPP